MGGLQVENVERAFYGVHALNGVSLTVAPRGITGLIGPNGAGKTTLFNCISGVIPPDRGRIVFDGRDITGLRPDRVTSTGLIRTFQIARGVAHVGAGKSSALRAHQPGEKILHA